MGLPSLFKLPPHKQFNFKTRHYDAVKEEFEERVERAKRDAGITGAVNEEGVYVQNIKGQMRRQKKRNVGFDRNANKSNFRIVIIASVLGAIAYYLFYM